MDNKSSTLGLTANQCSREQILTECMRQIKKGFSGELPKPYRVTFADGLYRKGGKWISKNTGYTRKPGLGYLPMRGNMKIYLRWDVIQNKVEIW